MTTSCERWRSTLAAWVEAQSLPEIPEDIQTALLSHETWRHIEGCEDCYEQYWTASAQVHQLEAAREEMATEAAVDRMVAWVQQQAPASEAEATAGAMALVGEALAKAGDDFLTGLANLKDWVVARTTFDYVGALAAPGVRGRAGATADRALSYLEIPALEQGGWRSQVEVSAQHELRMVFEPQKGVADDELAVLRAAVRTMNGEWVESPAEPGPVPLQGDPRRRYLLVVWSSATESYDGVFDSSDDNIRVWFEPRR